MTTLCMSELNVIDSAARFQAQGPSRMAIEERIRQDVLKQLGSLHPCLDYTTAQALNGWRSLKRTPDEAVAAAVRCARSSTREPDSAA